MGYQPGPTAAAPAAPDDTTAGSAQEVDAELGKLAQVRRLMERWVYDRDGFPDGAGPVLEEISELLVPEPRNRRAWQRANQ